MDTILWILVAVFAALFLLLLIYIFYRYCVWKRGPPDILPLHRDSSHSLSTIQIPSTDHSSLSSVTVQVPPDDHSSPSSVTKQEPSIAHSAVIRPSIPPPSIPDGISSDRIKRQSRRSYLSRQYSISSTNSLNLHLTYGDVPVSKVLSWERRMPKLDLHTMTVKEAIKVTEKFLDRSYGRHRKVLIVTGRGVHSRGGVPKLRPAIERLLHEYGYPYRLIYGGGCFEVDLI